MPTHTSLRNTAAIRECDGQYHHTHPTLLHFFSDSLSEYQCAVVEALQKAMRQSLQKQAKFSGTELHHVFQIIKKTHGKE